MNFDFPMAAIKMSALFVCSFKSLVFEWHTVTVAFLFKQHCINGFPTILLLPIITSSFPVKSILFTCYCNLKKKKKKNKQTKTKIT